MLNEMPLKWVPIKGQKFDLGRTINPMKCENCGNCDYLNCNNYAVQMKRGKYTLTEWLDFYKDELKKSSALWNRDIVCALFDDLIGKFPKNLYWDYDDKYWHKIRFIEMTRNGHEHEVGSISTKDCSVSDMDFSETKRKFVNKISELMIRIEAMV